MDEPRYGWVVVAGAFFSLAVIFGVSYSFAAFFESFAREFAAQRADVALVFGLSGLIYFVLGAVGGMLADRYGPRVVTPPACSCIAAALLGEQLRDLDGARCTSPTASGSASASAWSTRRRSPACSRGSRAAAGSPPASPAPASAPARW